MDIISTIKRFSGRKSIVGQSEYLNLWNSYYSNNQSSAYYKITTGSGTEITAKKKSLNMPKKVVEDFSNFILNEKCQIIIPEKSQLLLDKFLDKSQFWSRANVLLEQTMALSIGAIVEGVKGLEVDENGAMTKKGRLKIRYINATMVYPITIEDGEITECAFASENTQYTEVEMHLLNEEGNYVVKIFRMDTDAETVIPFEDGTDVIEFNTLSNIPLFQIMRPNLVNNLKINSQLPISVFANCLTNFDCIDEKYDDFDVEFKNGKKRIFVNSKLWKVNAMDGSVQKTFDPNDTLFYALDFEDNSKPLIESSSDPLREASYIEAINFELNLISSKLGLGKGFYNVKAVESSRTSMIAKSATEVLAMSAETVRTIKKHEIVINEVLINFTRAIQYLSNTFLDDPELPPLGDFASDDIRIIFDDSVFEDKSTEQQRDITNMQAGLMSEVEYRMRWYNEDEQSAKKYVYNNLRFKIIGNNLQGLTSGAMPPKIFVDICYGDKTEAEKAEIEAYITEQLEKSSMTTLDFYNEPEEATD